MDQVLGARNKILYRLKLIPVAYYSPFILALAVTYSYVERGWGHLYPILIVFAALPLLDALLGLDRNNLNEEDAKKIKKSFFYRLPHYFYSLYQLGLLIFVLNMIQTDTSIGHLEFLILALNTALLFGAAGVTIGHEVVHKNSWADRLSGNFLMTCISYTHFTLEHVYGHHVNVATPLDPTSSRKGESLYKFWPKTIIGSFMHAWNFEKTRMKKLGLPLFNKKNRMLFYTSLPLIAYLSITLIFGFKALLFFLVVSIAAILFIESVNYIEHYGLQRKEIAPGKYERVTHHHSWNSSHVATNYFTYNIQKHSHHHASASQPYQILKHFDDSPQMPYSYPVMIALAFIPPLFFKVMDPLLDEINQRQAL